MPRTITAAIRRNARAFLIWRYCFARDWDCTIPEVAKALGLTVDTVRGYCVKRKWIARMRSTQTDSQTTGRFAPEDGDDAASDVLALIGMAA